MSSSLADRWSLFDRVIQKRRYKKIISYIPEGCVLADLGCGNGDLLLRISARINHGYGIDTKVERNDKDSKLTFKSADLNSNIPLGDESVDVVTALAVLEHLTNPDNFVKEIVRILKPNGCFIMTTPSPKAKRLLELLAYKLKVISENDIRDHKTYYGKEQLLDLFAKFSLVKIDYFQFGLNTVVIASK